MSANPIPNPALNLNDRDNRPSLKAINISFAILNKSNDAFTELMLARSRDSIIITCETPVTDNPSECPRIPPHIRRMPPRLPPPRVCAYISNSVIDFLDKFTCSRDIVTINLIDGWTIVASYTDPSLHIDPQCYDSTTYRFLIATGNDTISLSCTTSLSPALLTTPILLLLRPT